MADQQESICVGCQHAELTLNRRGERVGVCRWRPTVCAVNVLVSSLFIPRNEDPLYRVLTTSCPVFTPKESPVTKQRIG